MVGGPELAVETYAICFPFAPVTFRFFGSESAHDSSPRQRWAQCDDFL